MEHQINLRNYEDGTLGLSLDETVSENNLNDLMSFFDAKPENDAS